MRLPPLAAAPSFAHIFVDHSNFELGAKHGEGAIGKFVAFVKIEGLVALLQRDAGEPRTRYAAGSKEGGLVGKPRWTQYYERAGYAVDVQERGAAARRLSSA